MGFTPNGVPDKIVAESIRLNTPKPGTDYDWDQPVKLKTPGINGSTVPLPYDLDPARVPVASSYRDGSQQCGTADLGLVPVKRPTMRTRWW